MAPAPDGPDIGKGGHRPSCRALDGSAEAAPPMPVGLGASTSGLRPPVHHRAEARPIGTIRAPHDLASEAHVSELLHDLRHGVRVLLRARAFSIVAVLVLGVGIGATTTIFSAINGVLLRPLPYE